MLLNVLGDHNVVLSVRHRRTSQRQMTMNFRKNSFENEDAMYHFTQRFRNVNKLYDHNTSLRHVINHNFNVHFQALWYRQTRRIFCTEAQSSVLSAKGLIASVRATGNS